jgi:peptide/nickel transport system substrate-binding protein
LSDLGRAADRAVERHPYDLRRGEQLMAEAGYARGPDGVYVKPGAGRLELSVVTQDAADNNAEIAVLADGWQRAGFAAEQKLLTGAVSRQPEVLATFPDVLLNSAAATVSLLDDFRGTNIPTPQNRWGGSNRGGWNNAEYTALAEGLATMLDPQQRMSQMEQIGRVFSGQLPALTLFYRSVVFAHTTALTGVTNAPPDSTVPWNIHEWELQ